MPKVEITTFVWKARKLNSKRELTQGQPEAPLEPKPMSTWVKPTTLLLSVDNSHSGSEFRVISAPCPSLPHLVFLLSPLQPGLGSLSGRTTGIYRLSYLIMSKNLSLTLLVPWHHSLVTVVLSFHLISVTFGDLFSSIPLQCGGPLRFQPQLLFSHFLYVIRWGPPVTWP